MRNFLVLTLLACLLHACNGPETITTEHGFRFINHTNKGGKKPKPGDWVVVQTYARIKDSLMLDTQRDFGGAQESELAKADQIQGKIPAMYDAILLMGVGDSATVYEPLDSAAMNYVPESLKDATEVAYTMVLVKLTTPEEKIGTRKRNAEAIPSVISDFKAGKLNNKLKKTNSGLKILVAEEGNGQPVVAGEMVNVEYYGAEVSSGRIFDNSVDRGQPLMFVTGAGQMIAGFDEGVQQLKHGTKAYLFIPAALGYGETGQPQANIPPNADLIFYIEVL